MRDDGLVDVTLLGAAQALELLGDGRMSAEELTRDRELVAAVAPEGEATAPANPMLGSTNAPSAPVQSEPHYWIVRERVAWVKQEVILAPATAYPPGAPQTQAVTAQLRAPSQQIREYEASHPALDTRAAAFSGYRKRAAKAQLQAASASRALRSSRRLVIASPA